MSWYPVGEGGDRPFPDPGRGRLHASELLAIDELRRSVAPPKIWQLHRVPCWDRVLVKIATKERPACMAYVSRCTPEMVFLNQTASPGLIQTYKVVYFSEKTSEYLWVENLEVELGNFDSFHYAWLRVEEIPSRPKNGEPVCFVFEDPDEHQMRGRCPYCQPPIGEPACRDETRPSESFFPKRSPWTP